MIQKIVQKAVLISLNHWVFDPNRTKKFTFSRKNGRFNRNEMQNSTTYKQMSAIHVEQLVWLGW